MANVRLAACVLALCWAWMGVVAQVQCSSFTSTNPCSVGMEIWLPDPVGPALCEPTPSECKPVPPCTPVSCTVLRPTSFWTLGAVNTSCTETCSDLNLPCQVGPLSQTDDAFKIVAVAAVTGAQCGQVSPPSTGFDFTPAIGGPSAACIYNQAGLNMPTCEALPEYQGLEIQRFCCCGLTETACVDTINGAGNWTLGAVNASCTETCTALGLPRQENQLSQVNSAFRMSNLASSIGVHCDSIDPPSADFNFTPAIGGPSAACVYNQAGLNMPTCDAPPESGGLEFQRFCCCGFEGETCKRAILG